MSGTNLAFQINPFSILLVGTALFANAAVLFILYKLKDQRSRFAAFLMFAITIWMVGAALELTSLSQEAMSFWMQVQFTGICTAPIIWLAYTYVHTNKLSRSSIRKLMLFSIPTILSLALVYTNGFHGLIFSKISLIQHGSYLIGAYDFGIGFGLVIGYTFLVYFAGVHILVREHFLVGRVFRLELFALLTALFFPMAIYIFLDRFGQTPHLGVRISPLAFGITVPLATLLINKLHTMDLMPLTRDFILDNIENLIIVVNPDNQIIDLNKASQNVFAPQGKPMIGVHVEALGIPNLLSQLKRHNHGNTQPNLAFKLGDKNNYYNLKITPLLNQQGNLLANVILLNDITDINKRSLEMSSLLEAMQAVSSNMDLDGAINVIAEQITATLQADGCTLSYWDRENDAVVVWIEYRKDPLEITDKAGTIYALDQFPTTRFVLENREVVTVNASVPNADPAEITLMQLVETANLLMLPLIVGDSVVGLVEVDHNIQKFEYSAYDIRLAQSLCNQAGIAIHNANLLAATQQQLKKQTILHGAVSAISSALDLSDVLTRLAEHMCIAVQATSAYVVEYDLENKTGTVLAEYYSDDACEAEKVSDLGENFAWDEPDFFKNLSPRNERYSHLDDEDILDDEREMMEKYEVKSILYMPLIVKERPVGAIEIYESRRRREYSEEEIALCRAISHHAGVAIENANLYKETQKALSKQVILHDAARAISSALDFNEVLSRIAEKMCIAVDATSAYICDYNPEQETSTVLAEYISDSANKKEVTSDIGVTYDEYIELEDEFIRRLREGLHDHSHVDDDDISDVERAHMEEYEVKSILYIPLMLKNRPIGFVEIWESRQKRIFTDEEISMCQTIAQQAAIAIENADLFENAQNEIEERKKIEERLYFDATHDDLTGLSNRKIFLERLEQVCRQPAGVQARYFAVLFMDFDRFKVVNDSLGHASGDQLLIESARRIQECLRPSDLLSRLGGDEFVILLEDIISLEYATRIADRIQDVITQPFFIREREIYITTSIGILFDRAANQHAEDLIRDADIAMYRAKDSGKARYAIFAPEFRSEAISRLEMESALRRALDQQELEVYYQPIFSLQNDQLQGFEALVRWCHPEQGMIAPRKFIPLAEETNLIIQIDRWILREACQQMAVWQDEYPQNPHLTISVNMSGQNLSRPGLVDFIQSVLNACNFPSEQLHLEITESTIMQYAQSTVSLLDNLQRLGVKLHIDDFGTGYSSLSYLHRFPLDALKIDRSFVRNMGENEGSSGLVSTIIKLAHTLNMAVIAEGVETINQKRFLKSMQCEQAQGYYLAKPMDKSSIENILLQKSTIKRAQTV